MGGLYIKSEKNQNYILFPSQADQGEHLFFPSSKIIW